MKLKKLTALFLSVLMLLSVLPAALAEDATPQYGGMLTVLAMESNSMFPALSSTTSNRFNFSPAVEALGRRNAETGDTVAGGILHRGRGCADADHQAPRRH